MKHTGLFICTVKTLSLIFFILISTSCKDHSNTSSSILNNEDQSPTSINESSTYGIKASTLNFSQVHLQSGSYSNECYREVGDIYFKEEAVIQDSLLTRSIYEYSDKDCKDLVRVMVQTSTLTALELMKPSKTDSVFRLSLLLKETKFMIHSPERLDYFNKNQVFEINNWTLDTYFDIDGKLSFPEDPDSYREPKAKTTIVRYLKLDSSSKGFSISEDLSSIDEAKILVKTQP